MDFSSQFAWDIFMSLSSEVSATSSPTSISSIRLLFDVFKLRIGAAIGVTALAGVAVTPGQAPATWRIAVLAASVTLASAAAGAFNQYMERDLDAQMRRTRDRPFAAGRFAARPEWLAAIALLGTGGVALAGFAGGAASAIYTLCGAFTYGVVYTVWLKRRTAWNIVIGGLAGSFAVLAGAAAVSPHSLLPLPICFALVLLLWTPPHFWSFAIAYRADYEAAKVPMLPVLVGDRRAARTVFAGALLLVAATFIPVALGMGPIYLAGATIGGLYLLTTSTRLARNPTRRNAMANFHASLLQLALLLLTAIVDAAMRG